MDFKPFNEVVLPPEKGTRIKKGESDLEKTVPLPQLSVSKPREFHFFNEPIVVMDQPRAVEMKESPAPPSIVAKSLPKEIKEEREKSRAEISQTAVEPAERPGHTSSPPAPQDFIIAYSGNFIGHYQSGRRITNRKAFQNVARQLHGEIYGFDPSLLQLYKLVPVQVEGLVELGECCADSFRWFAKEDNSHVVPSL